jgi:hypothetical protein
MKNKELYATRKANAYCSGNLSYSSLLQGCAKRKHTFLVISNAPEKVVSSLK